MLSSKQMNALVIAHTLFPTNLVSKSENLVLTFNRCMYTYSSSVNLRIFLFFWQGSCLTAGRQLLPPFFLHHAGSYGIIPQIQGLPWLSWAPYFTHKYPWKEKEHYSCVAQYLYIFGLKPYSFRFIKIYQVYFVLTLVRIGNKKNRELCILSQFEYFLINQKQWSNFP